MCFFPWRVKCSSWAPWGWLPGSLLWVSDGRLQWILGLIYQFDTVMLQSEHQREHLMCDDVRTAMSSGVLHNLMTWIVGRDGVLRRWNWHGDGVLAVYTCCCTVAKVWLLILPLARSGVRIWLYWGSSLPVDECHLSARQTWQLRHNSR